MAHRETAYQIIARQADRIRELEELLHFYEYQPLPETTTKSTPDTEDKKPHDLMSPLIFLEKIFNEQREWARDEINRRGRQQYGYTSDEIFQVAQPLFSKCIDVFTEFTGNGQKYFVWRAKPGWPKIPKKFEITENTD